MKYQIHRPEHPQEGDVFFDSNSGDTGRIEDGETKLTQLVEPTPKDLAIMQEEAMNIDSFVELDQWFIGKLLTYSFANNKARISLFLSLQIAMEMLFCEYCTSVCEEELQKEDVAEIADRTWRVRRSVRGPATHIVWNDILLGPEGISPIMTGEIPDEAIKWLKQEASKMLLAKRTIDRKHEEHLKNILTGRLFTK